MSTESGVCDVTAAPDWWVVPAHEEGPVHLQAVCGECDPCGPCGPRVCGWREAAVRVVRRVPCQVHVDLIGSADQILTTVEAVQDCLLGNTQDTFGWLIISLAMPYCGYYGGTHPTRNASCTQGDADTWPTRPPLHRCPHASWKRWHRQCRGSWRQCTAGDVLGLSGRASRKLQI